MRLNLTDKELKDNEIKKKNYKSFQIKKQKKTMIKYKGKQIEVRI